MYPYSLTKTRSSSPFVSHCISTRHKVKLSSYAFVTSLVLALVSRSHCRQKVIDIRLCPLPSLSPITSPSTSSSLVLLQCYHAYSITQSFLFPFYLRRHKVINFPLFCYYPFNPFASSSFHPLAYTGCWWDLRRDPFTFIFALYLSLVHSGVCVVFRLSTHDGDCLNTCRTIYGNFALNTSPYDA
jgi:hypothetical protein